VRRAESGRAGAGRPDGAAAGGRPVRTAALALALALAAGLSGCATISPVVPWRSSYALPDPGTTPLGRAMASDQAAHPGKSGFHLLAYDLEALVARVALADAAQRTIDVQYYIYDSDAAGSILTEHLLAAADRGVRVRMLIDDYNVHDDRELVDLCANPNIQVRIFNPVGWRSGLFRLPEYLLDFRHSDHRMHNKLFVVDNEVSILGGRNIGNDYFDLDTDNAFRDFDVLEVGPVTRQASAVFDEFWNSQWAVPAPDLAGRRPTAADLAWARRRIASRLAGAGEFERLYAATRRSYLENLESDGELVWAPGRIVAEPPRKIADSSPATDEVADQLGREWRQTRREVLIEAAYFVPGRTGLDTFRRLRARGVKIRLLTSSLEATDVPIVYCAYRNYRKALLRAGVDLYEFKLHGPRVKSAAKWYRLGPSYMALHSKVMVFDRRRVWIGSFNLDPRSAKLNTEIAVVVDSPALAAQVEEDIAEDMSPERSWHVRLVPRPDGQGERVAWTGEQGGRPATLFHEPASWRANLGAFFLSLIPGLEGQL
jgi:cardiolipin synthase C